MGSLSNETGNTDTWFYPSKKLLAWVPWSFKKVSGKIDKCTGFLETLQQLYQIPTSHTDPCETHSS